MNHTVFSIANDLPNTGFPVFDLQDSNISLSVESLGSLTPSAGLLREK